MKKERNILAMFVVGKAIRKQIQLTISSSLYIAKKAFAKEMGNAFAYILYSYLRAQMIINE